MVYMLKAAQTEMPVPVNVDTAYPCGCRRLMVSDNPETLDDASLPGPVGTLWQDAGCTNTGETAYRVFGWHLNRKGRPLRIGLTLQNRSPFAPVTVMHARRFVVFSSGDYLRAGLRLAGSYMAQRMYPVLPSFTVTDVAARSTKLLDEILLPDGNLTGFIYEFTLRGDGVHPVDAVLRTVAAALEYDRSLDSIDSPPLPLSGTHPRGGWPFADVLGTTSVYRVGQNQFMSESLSNGQTDRLLTASTSFDPVHAVRNFGHFGAVYKVNIPVQNDTGQEQTVRVRLNPRGGAYAGAVAVSGIVRLVPVLRPGGDNVATIGCWLVSPGLNRIEFDVMHAGASSLPVAVHVDTVYSSEHAHSRRYGQQDRER